MVLHTEWDHLNFLGEKTEEKCLFESGALSRGLQHTLWRTCYLMGAELSDRLFGWNKPFFSAFLIYVYVCFVENVAVSVL